MANQKLSQNSAPNDQIGVGTEFQRPGGGIAALKHGERAEGGNTAPRDVFRAKKSSQQMWEQK